MSQPIARERCFARMRDDLRAYREFPPASIEITNEEWLTMSFECYTPHDDFPEFQNGDGWNMLLVHPTKGIFFAYTIDFDFEVRGE